MRSLGKFLFQGKIPCVFNLSSEPVRQNQRQLVLCGVLNRPVQVNDSVDSKFLDVGIYRICFWTGWCLLKQRVML